MIFVDSNVPMYLVGADHPNKSRLLQILDPLVRAGETMITSVEVFQEIMHRYVAIDRREAIAPAMEALASLVDDTLSFDLTHIYQARSLVETHDGLSARDALHVAVMHGAGVRQVLSFDRGFDVCPGIERIG